MVFPSEICCQCVMERYQPKGVVSKTREDKLRIVINCHGALQHSGVKQTDIKQGMCVYSTGRLISDKGKPTSSEKKFSKCTVHIIKPIWTALRSNPDLRRHKPASYCLNYVTAFEAKSTAAAVHPL
jgi:hypothetical protein